MENPTQTPIEISSADRSKEATPMGFISEARASLYARLAAEKPHYYHYKKTLDTKKRLAVREFVVFAALLILAALVMSGLS